MKQSGSSTPVGESGNSSRQLAILAALFIAGYFLFFTWRGLLVYYTGDDMMNLYGYWTKPVSALVKGNLFFWTPFYRPFGGIIYRPLFAIFGFNPYPLYIVFYAAMLLNLWIAFLVFRRIGGSGQFGALATLLWAYHGKLDYLYYNAGSLYDVFCFMFYFLGLLIYLRARMQGRFLGVFGTLGFLVCFVCALNSKEMAATLPVIVLVYELIFHPPDFRGIRQLLRWPFYEGRMALLGALCVLIYIPAKLSTQGLTSSPAYVPSYTWARYLGDTGNYLADLVYRNDPSAELGVAAFTPLGIAIFYGLLIALALWMRSRVMAFGLLFFVVALLPVSFVTSRLGFVLYLPLAGMALYVAVCLMRFKKAVWQLFSEALGPDAGTLSASSSLSASVVLFLATALVLAGVAYRNWPIAPEPQHSPQRRTISDFAQLYPRLPHGSKLLFVHSALDPTWDLLFLLRNYYRDPDLFLTLMNGPMEQRIAPDRLPHYDHVFDYVDGHYKELDNADPLLSMKLHLFKTNNPADAFGETMTIGHPGASQYVVKGVLVGDPKSTAYWTLDQPELNFLLSSTNDHFFHERFYLPQETLKQTGPLVVDFYVNGHYLDQARFAKDGEIIYRHDVPPAWLKTRDLTSVQMKVHNPYIAPRDGAKLGVLLMSAGFSPAASL